MPQNPDQEKWDKRYRDAVVDWDGPFTTLTPARVLWDYQHLLPLSGKALDLACGLGINALFLARQGLQVSAWDISPVAIEGLTQAALSQSALVDAQVRDVVQQPPGPRSFDVIVVSRFLERDLFPHIINALKPRGLLFYQTFIADKDPAVGPANPEYLLAPNELLALCGGLRILAYREEGGIGDRDKGFRNEAMIVARQTG